MTTVPREVFVKVGRTEDGREWESPYPEAEAIAREKAYREGKLTVTTSTTHDARAKEPMSTITADLIARAGPRDWPEFFHHENGCYQNACVTCAQLFLGPKRARECKLCAGNQVST